MADDLPARQEIGSPLLAPASASGLIRRHGGGGFEAPPHLGGSGVGGSAAEDLPAAVELADASRSRREERGEISSIVGWTSPANQLREPAAMPFRSAPRGGEATFQLAPHRSAHAVGAGTQGDFIKQVHAQIKGLYLVKFAVSVTACYLLIQLLITFAEVLLPFIFAVLCTMILEPLKRFIMGVFSRLLVLLFQALRLKVCLENGGPERGAEDAFHDEGENATVYGRLPQDSPAEDAAAAPSGRPAEQRAGPEPAGGLKKAILAFSILLCMLLTGRLLWLISKVFLRAGYAISGNLDYYREGASRLKMWFHKYIHEIHMEALDYGKLLDGLVTEVEAIGKIVTQSVLYTALQAVVTFIFLIYMLWSPIKMESSTVTREVFQSTARYLKVKCVISAFTGLSVTALLWAIGLDLPAAFGLLAFLANFLPGIGSFVASVLPCILAIIDVRKTPTQVLLAFACQAVVHFCIDFFIEPVFFGISVEIHSVIVILGIWFFYQVWGVPGMLLSVPLLAVVRIMMKTMKRAARVRGVEGGGEDADTLVFLDNVLEGRWMSSVGSNKDEEEFELPDFPLRPTPSEGPPSEPGGDPEALLGLQKTRYGDPWAAVRDTQAMMALQRFYQAHALSVDCILLLLIIGLILFAPL